MKKILHAITRLDKGGSSSNTLLSAVGLVGKGYKVDLLYGKTNNPDEALLDKARSAGVNFIEEKTLLRDIHPVRDIQALLRVFRLLKKGKYDILHAHTSKAGLICRLAGKMAGIKHLVYTPHGHVFYGYFNNWKTRAVIFIEAMLAHLTDRIIGLTPAECEQWRGFGVGKDYQYVFVPSGIDFSYFERPRTGGNGIRNQLDIPTGKKIIGSAGRFVKVKGYEFFIAAAVSVLDKRDDAVFILAGSGEQEKKYKKMIKSSGHTDKFFIIPWQDNPVDLIRAMDIFVLPSINEGMGRVLAEAMYLEKAVIATNVGGVPGLVSKNEGILVPSGSASFLADAMEKLLDAPAMAMEFGKKAKNRVLEQYSCDTMIDKLDMIYSEFLVGDR
jgi:glycosyltransferase involved in cell wall biosynthesis